jgi:hypothetical protein
VQHQQPRYSVRNILIDRDNWKKYKLSHHDLRADQVKQIESMLLCNDPSKGFFYYRCDDCEYGFTRGFRCNSRVCSRCGTSYVNKWAQKTTQRLLKVGHSHIIFTMPACLWPLIKDNWDCIKELAATAYKVLVETMSRSAKQPIAPGMISSLHTYGADMKYNVHFHTIVTNGGMSAKTKVWKNVDYLPYEILRIKWKIYCTQVITKHIAKTAQNQKVLEAVYYDYRSGFNVKVIKTKIPTKELIRYIARYIRHPPISNRRIVDYNGEWVTIVCGKKNNNYYVRYSTDEFITRLLWHIPQKGFKLIRYYGIYCRTKINKPPKTDKQETITKYTQSKLSLPCPKCGKILNPIEYFPPTIAKGPPQELLHGSRITDWLTTS